jgi:hypothetical protein
MGGLSPVRSAPIQGRSNSTSTLARCGLQCSRIAVMHEQQNSVAKSLPRCALWKLGLPKEGHVARSSRLAASARHLALCKRADGGSQGCQLSSLKHHEPPVSQVNRPDTRPCTMAKRALAQGLHHSTSGSARDAAAHRFGQHGAPKLLVLVAVHNTADHGSTAGR